MAVGSCLENKLWLENKYADTISTASTGTATTGSLVCIDCYDCTTSLFIAGKDAKQTTVG